MAVTSKRRRIDLLVLAATRRMRCRCPRVALAAVGATLVVALWQLRAAAGPREAYRRGSRIMPRTSPGHLRQSSDELFAANMSGEVLRMMHHAWGGYRNTSWGRDTSSPVSGGKGHNWLNMGATIIDAFSTLWLMSLKDKSLVEEVERSADWIRSELRFNATEKDVSFFETTIRIIGGLNAAHSLTGRSFFLEKSADLGMRLLTAFGTRHVSPSALEEGRVGLDALRGLPQSNIDPKNGNKHRHSWVNGINLAEAGTHQLEFRYLAQQTGDTRFAELSDGAINLIFAASGSHGLVPNVIDQTGRAFTGSLYTMGATQDSYYEYLLKVWLQGGRVDAEHLRRWKLAVGEMRQQLVRKDARGLTYLGTSEGDTMEHLACYVPGMLINGVYQLPPGEAPQEWATLAAELAHTCHEMYVQSPIGLGPDAWSFSKRKNMTIYEGKMILRPEAVESWYYMWYYTGDPKYRRWAADAVANYNRWSKREYGYAPLGDVRRPEHVESDSSESFFYAETLKYLFLIFQDRAFFSLEDWVFNTEGHPVRVLKPKER